jgi:hypothetical protein
LLSKSGGPGAPPQEPNHHPQDPVESRQSPPHPAPAAAGTSEVLPEARWNELVERITETLGSRMPALVEQAAEKLSVRVTEQLSRSLEHSGLDVRDIVNSIAWQVVPDVAEMLVRRELEEIRRHI